MNDANHDPGGVVAGGEAPARFASLAALRAAHGELLKGHREKGDTPEFPARVEAFLRRGRATGALLDREDDRWAAQSLLDYWDTMLYRAGREPPDATLAEFDPTLAPELDDALCPYQGLDAFRQPDAPFFFGRQRLMDEMVRRLETDCLLAVVGPSGSGKSSLVLAGLLPALQAGAVPGSEGWHYTPRMVPGSHPLTNLARALRPNGAETADWFQRQVEGFRQSADHLARLADSLHDSPGDPLVLVIDQFEEVFTLCGDDERRAFVDNLLSLVQASAAAPGKRHTVILTMRIDFEDHVTRLPEFHQLYQRAAVRVTPLSASELREAIERPAELVGLKFEEGVVDALLQDILGEPAALPLLQFTLLKLWDTRQRNRVTWDTYRRLGGGRQALAHSADELYEGLIPEEQVTARRILLRMVHPGEGLEVTSNRIRRETLYQTGEARDRIDRVLDRLVQARLVRLTAGDTLADAQVEVAHEALVRNWPRLVEWLEEERETMRRRLRLTVAAEQWQATGREPEALLRGSLLDEALRYEDLNELEAEFVQASQAAIEREHQQELAHQRELARAQARAEAERERAELQARARKRLLWLVAALVVVALLAIGAAAFAGVQQKRAGDAADARATEVVVRRVAEAEALDAQARAESERDRAEQQLRLSTALRLAAVANNQLNIDPERSVLLALEAVAATYDADQTVTREADQALHRTVQASSVILTLLGKEDQVSGVVFSPDGTRLAATLSWDEGVVWDATTGKELFTLAGHDGSIKRIVYSADGTRLATASTDDTAKMWDAATGEELLTLDGHENWVIDVAFSPDGTHLATASTDDTAKVWDAATGEELLTLTVPDDSIRRVAFSPDGTRLATATWGDTLQIWDLAAIMDSGSAGALIFESDDLAGDERVVFSPDGTRLATAGYRSSARVWDVESGTELFVLEGHTDTVRDVVFSSGGTHLATAGDDRMAKVWDAATGEEVLTLTGHGGEVVGVAFNPDGTHLATASRDGAVRVWDLSASRARSALAGHTNKAPHRTVIHSLALSPDGTHLATGSAGGTVAVWDLPASTTTGSAQQAFSPLEHPSSIWDLAFSPDGTYLATTSRETVRVWDPALGHELLTFVGHRDGVEYIAYSPDGARLATASSDRLAKIWSATSGQELVTLDGHDDWIGAVDFGDDGRQVLTLSRDNTAKLWDAESGEELDTLTCRITDDDGFSISSDWTRFAIAVDDGTVRICDAASGRDLFTFVASDGEVTSVSFGPDGTRLVTISGGTLVVWDADALATGASGAELFTLETGPRRIRDRILAENGRHLVTADAAGAVQVWDLAASSPAGPGDELLTFPGHADMSVYGVAFSPDVARLATAGWQTAKVWDLQVPAADAPSEEMFTLCCHNGWIWQVAFSADGTHLATASTDGQVSIWDPASGELLFSLPAHDTGVNAVAFDPRGTRLATGGDDATVKVWDLDSGQELFALSGHHGEIESIAFSPDGTRLVTGDELGMARVWDPTTGEELLVFPGHDRRINAIAVSPDGRLVATASWDDTVRVWDAATGHQWHNLAAHTASVQTVAFDAEGTRLATGGADRTVRVWDVASGEELFTIAGYPDTVRGVAFSPDGSYLVAYSQDGTVHTYSLDIEVLRTLACERATRNLSKDEWRTFVGPHVPYRETCPGLPVPP